MDEIAINKLDQAAKKAKLSRQVFLCNLIERLAYQEAFTDERSQIEKILHESQQQTKQYLQQQQDLFQKITRIETMLEMLFDVDAGELNEQLMKIIGKELADDEK